MAQAKAKAVEQLDAQIAKISASRKALKKEMRSLVAKRDALAAQEAVAAKLAAMSPAEREAMAGALTTAPGGA